MAAKSRRRQHWFCLMLRVGDPAMTHLAGGIARSGQVGLKALGGSPEQTRAVPVISRREDLMAEAGLQQGQGGPAQRHSFPRLLARGVPALSGVLRRMAKKLMAEQLANSAARRATLAPGALTATLQEPCFQMKAREELLVKAADAPLATEPLAAT